MTGIHAGLRRDLAVVRAHYTRERRRAAHAERAEDLIGPQTGTGGDAHIGEEVHSTRGTRRGLWRRNPVGLYAPTRRTPISPPDVQRDRDEGRSTGYCESFAKGSGRLATSRDSEDLPRARERSENVNDDIGSLVKKGLPVKIQRALDPARVTGNDRVHPRQIDLRDDVTPATLTTSDLNYISPTSIESVSH